MKTLLIAGFAAAWLAGQPAVAQSEPADPAPAKAERAYKVGDRLPGRLVNHRHTLGDPAQHQLKAPAQGQKWIQVGALAYLVDARTDRVLAVANLSSR